MLVPPFLVSSARCVVEAELEDNKAMMLARFHALPSGGNLICGGKR